jgi:hypothetical protein
VINQREYPRPIANHVLSIKYSSPPIKAKLLPRAARIMNMINPKNKIQGTIST